MKRIVITAVLFIAFALMYFLGVSCPYCMAVPLAILALASIGTLSWQLCLAFGLSCLGDAASYWSLRVGADTAFIIKMGFFAAAHFFFIFFFLRQWPNGPRSHHHRHLCGMAAAVLALAVFVLLRVVPHVPAGVLRLGVAGYSLIICAMLFSAAMTRDWVWGIGAVLFVYSDFIYAWDSFCAPVPGAGYLIMIPYFGAQLLFYLRSVSKTRLGYTLSGAPKNI